MMKEMGRLAMRHEGSHWNAYYALKESMEGAVFLGSIAMAAVAENRERKQAFMDMMRDVVSDILEDCIGARPEWNEPQTAPEHEARRPYVMTSFLSDCVPNLRCGDRRSGFVL